MCRFFCCEKVKVITVASLLFVVSGCVRLPAVDAAAKGPQIDTLVRRVKCDLYEALYEPLAAPQGYEWLHTWTTQASLNLIVADQSQLTPGATFTTPMKAVTVPLVVTNFAQSFNLGLGAQWSNTATRNETITFTVSMDDLINEFGKGSVDCRFPNDIDLQSDLGLKEWVFQSLSPVVNHYLDIGYHKPPKTGTGPAAANVAKTLQATGSAIGAAIGPVSGRVREPAAPNCERPSGRHSEAPSREAIQLDLRVVVCDLFTFQPGPLPSTVPPAAPLQPGTSPPAPAPTTSPPVHDLTNLDSETVVFVVKTIKDIQKTVSDLTILGETSQKTRIALENTATALAVFVDPPIDTLSHQAQFIIVLNGSVTPSWTLLRFKGPSPSTGAMASLTNTKTHTLNIVIGPPGSLDAQGALQALQTGTALTNALNTSNLSLLVH